VLHAGERLIRWGDWGHAAVLAFAYQDPRTGRAVAVEQAVRVPDPESWRAARGPARIFHDFRRSTVRRFEQAGIARSVAMKLTGHKTENVYRRYAIVSDKELREAAATLSRLGDGHNSGHTRAAVRPGVVR
jgi:hypothetical protein